MQLQSLLCLLSLVAASPVRLPAPKVIHYDTTVRHIGGLEKRYAIKDTLAPTIDQRLTIPLYFGSEKKEVYVGLDTGSSYSWITAENYTLDTSTTGVDLGTSFEVNYDDNNVTGVYVKDTIANTVDGDGVEAEFGLATATALEQGLGGSLGLSKSSDSNYSFVDSMKSAGLIQSSSFSVWLADVSHGSITFGGVDVTKMATEFIKLPSDSSSGVFVQTFKAVLDGQEVTIASGNQGACTLDTGSTVTTLPSDLVDAIASAFGAVSASGSDEATAAGVPGDAVALKYQGSSSLKFESYGLEFEVPLWRYLAGNDYKPLQSEPEVGLWCVLSIVKGDSCIMSTNDVFQEYVVAFDFDNSNIGLAKSFSDAESDLGFGWFSEIGSDGLAGTAASSTAVNDEAFTVYTTASFN